MECVITRDQALRVLGKGIKNASPMCLTGHGSGLCGGWRRFVVISRSLFQRIRRFDDVTADRMTDQAIYHILKREGLRRGWPALMISAEPLHRPC